MQLLRSIRHRTQLVLALVLTPMVSTATDITCPPPDANQLLSKAAPPEIYTVDSGETDGEIDYMLFVDLEYNGYSLDGVVLAYESNGEVLLITSVKPVYWESQALISIVVNESISEDIRIYWTYREPAAICPRTVSFEHRLSAASFKESAASGP